MLTRTHHHRWDLYPAKSLAVRGGLARTFGGLVSFLAVTFLCTGIYILDDAFANPLAAQAVALVAAAFIIALATILLFYLLKPKSKASKETARQSRRAGSRPRQEFFEKVPAKAQNGAHGHELGYQRVYVDHSRVRP
jgi:hypothetical protein